ncbi:hypothetical protein [Methanimicrococcus hongohii]|uniref:hypothetical protein n=1 Tax=Methanimicrococcus hongohii TaxID=3028295 RepID=UPI0029316B20|nr:hypothetical protein [Methanimicrococcus sp. Hf6]
MFVCRGREVFVSGGREVFVCRGREVFMKKSQAIFCGSRRARAAQVFKIEKKSRSHLLKLKKSRPRFCIIKIKEAEK